MIVKVILDFALLMVLTSWLLGALTSIVAAFEARVPLIEWASFVIPVYGCYKALKYLGWVK